MRAVLLVPAPGDPLGLLAAGKCGARTPMAMWYPFSGGRWVEADTGSNPMTIEWLRALVLAWDGERVPEGILRAWFHADDVSIEVLSDLLYDEDDGLPGLVTSIGNLRRNGAPLGEVVTL